MILSQFFHHGIAIYVEWNKAGTRGRDKWGTIWYRDGNHARDQFGVYCFLITSENTH